MNKDIPKSNREMFLETNEYRRFAEFCDACRRYRYIGLCYGSPGVGKSLSAQHYANWFHLQAYASSTMPSAADFATVAGSTTVFYTPDVVNAPRRIAQDIDMQRHQLRMLAGEAWLQEQRVQSQVRKQEEARLPPKRMASPKRHHELLSGLAAQKYHSSANGTRTPASVA